MDAYTLHLLGLALDEMGGTLGIETYPGGPSGVNHKVIVSGSEASQDGASGPTLADALRALLDDLGVQYPERPSKERVAAVERLWSEAVRRGEGFAADDLRDLYVREPLTVLALLEGGGT